MKGYLALITTIGFIVILIGLSSGVLKTSDSPSILILFGSLSTNWGLAMGYYFGSAENTVRAPQRKTDEETKGEVKP